MHRHLFWLYTQSPSWWYGSYGATCVLTELRIDMLPHCKLLTLLQIKPKMKKVQYIGARNNNYKTEPAWKLSIMIWIPLHDICPFSPPSPKNIFPSLNP